MFISRFNTKSQRIFGANRRLLFRLLYNYFQFDGKRIVFRDKQENGLKNYLNNDEIFSVEHFIVSQSEETIHCLKRGGEYNYCLPDNIKAFHNYIFNYIFIPKRINRDILKNYYIKDKLNLLKQGAYLQQVYCEYSLMVISCAEQFFKLDFDFNNVDEKSVEDLEKYWAVKFGKQYNDYVATIIDKIFEKFATNK